MRAETCALRGAPDRSRAILRGGEGRVPSIGGRGQEMVEQDRDSGLSSLGEAGDRGGCPWLVERET